MSLDEQTELARRFSLGYEREMPDGRKWKDTERVQLVQSLSSEYNARLKSLGLRDYQVAHVMTSLDGFAMEAARVSLDAAADAVLARRDCALGVVLLEE